MQILTNTNFATVTVFQNIKMNKLASLEATLVQNYYDPATDLPTGVKYRATSLAKN